MIAIERRPEGDREREAVYGGGIERLPEGDRESTLGKRVTLKLGRVCTDAGAAIVNGALDETVRLMADDQTGETYWVLASVIRALPPTARREALPDRQARHPTRGL